MDNDTLVNIDYKSKSIALIIDYIGVICMVYR
jgi:hypothetical protein